MSINKKYNFNSFKITLKTEVKNKFTSYIFEDGIWNEEIETELKCYIENGFMYTFNACFDDDSKFITGVLDGSKFSIGYTNLMDNDEMQTLVNITQKDNYEEVGFGPDFVPVCYINEDTNMLFDIIVHFIKTGDKLDVENWE